MKQPTFFAVNLRWEEVVGMRWHVRLVSLKGVWMTCQLGWKHLETTSCKVEMHLLLTWYTGKKFWNRFSRSSQSKPSQQVCMLPNAQILGKGATTSPSRELHRRNKSIQTKRCRSESLQTVGKPGFIPPYASTTYMSWIQPKKSNNAPWRSIFWPLSKMRVMIIFPPFL